MLLFLLLLFSCSVVSNSLQPHGLQHSRLPVLHHLLEFAQTCIHWVCDAIQPSHPLSSPSPPAFNLSQHQGLFKWGGQSIGASASASVLPVNIQDWFPLGWTDLISLQSKRLSRVFSIPLHIVSYLHKLHVKLLAASNHIISKQQENLKASHSSLLILLLWKSRPLKVSSSFSTAQLFRENKPVK